MVVSKGKKIVPARDKKEKEAVDSVTIEHILKPPTPVYPKEKDGRDMLEANLKRIRCGKLWTRLWNLPWRYADEYMLREAVLQRSVVWPKTMRRKPEKWTCKVLAQKWHWRGRNCPPGRQT
jgi:hypothetical protein